LGIIARVYLFVKPFSLSMFRQKTIETSSVVHILFKKY